MQANHIQSLLVTNGEKIASKHAMRAICVDNARHHRARGNKEETAAEFAVARNYLKQLARLHTIQKALYTELKAHQRRERICVKSAKLNGIGVFVAASSDATTHELEAEVDRLIAVHFPKKPRPKAA